MNSPILHQIAGVFLPVSDVVKAREWYSRILGLENGGEILFGHLCCLPMEGTPLMLDTMPKWPGDGPAFIFKTDDIYAAHHFMQEIGVKLVTGIEDGRWFVFQDPDGNRIMVCE
jgi:catechol 2,3-dioxygenase-like lactoylglutathione lyase family enzyme